MPKLRQDQILELVKGMVALHGTTPFSTLSTAESLLETIEVLVDSI